MFVYTSKQASIQDFLKFGEIMNLLVCTTSDLYINLCNYTNVHQKLSTVENIIMYR